VFGTFSDVLGSNPAAGRDDSSCQYVLGCMVTDATNFNANATKSDDSCEFVWGCMDTEAMNYNTNATRSDGNCEYAMCTCSSPGNWSSGNNGYACTDGETGYCSHHIRECFSPNPFRQGRWELGCRIPQCKGVDSGCDWSLALGDGDCDQDSDCAANLRCGNKNCISEFNKFDEAGSDWDANDDCCTKIMCSCLTPRTGLEGHNMFECDDNQTGTCASNEKCHTTDSFWYGENPPCRLPLIDSKCFARFPIYEQSTDNGDKCVNPTKNTFGVGWTCPAGCEVTSNYEAPYRLETGTATALKCGDTSVLYYAEQYMPWIFATILAIYFFANL